VSDRAGQLSAVREAADNWRRTRAWAQTEEELARLALIQAVRRARAEGCTLREIGAALGVSAARVHQILDGRPE